MSIPLKIASAGSAVFAVTALFAGPVEAQEFCVVCTAPSAMYRCTIENYRPGSAPNLGALCSDNMKRVASHASCTVGKGITVLDCKGPLMRVDIANPASPVVTNVAVEEAKAAKEKKASEEPKTLLEMIKRSQSPAPSPPAVKTPQVPDSQPVKRSDQPADPAAPSAKAAEPKAQKTATEKPGPLADTWRCMSSFFTKCGD